jgi:hypothetical protein
MRWLLGWLVVLGAVGACTTPSEQVQDQALVPRHFRACAFDLQESTDWQFVASPETIGIKRKRANAEEAYYQNSQALMHVVCAPKSTAFEPWIHDQLNIMSNAHASFKIMSQETFVFQNAPAHWVLYEGTLKDTGLDQHGYILFVDRDPSGLMLALSAAADAQHRYSTAFRHAIDAVVLK